MDKDFRGQPGEYSGSSVPLDARALKTGAKALKGDAYRYVLEELERAGIIPKGTAKLKEKPSEILVTLVRSGKVFDPKAEVVLGDIKDAVASIAEAGGLGKVPGADKFLDDRIAQLKGLSVVKPAAPAPAGPTAEAPAVSPAKSKSKTPPDAPTPDAPPPTIKLGEEQLRGSRMSAEAEARSRLRLVQPESAPTNISFQDAASKAKMAQILKGMGDPLASGSPTTGQAPGATMEQLAEALGGGMNSGRDFGVASEMGPLAGVRQRLPGVNFTPEQMKTLQQIQRDPEAIAARVNKGPVGQEITELLGQRTTAGQLADQALGAIKPPATGWSGLLQGLVKSEGAGWQAAGTALGEGRLGAAAGSLLGHTFSGGLLASLLASNAVKTAGQFALAANADDVPSTEDIIAAQRAAEIRQQRVMQTLQQNPALQAALAKQMRGRAMVQSGLAPGEVMLGGDPSSGPFSNPEALASLIGMQ